MEAFDDRDSGYYLTRSLSLNVANEEFGDLQTQFLEFVLGEEGQGLIAEAGYFPLEPAIHGMMATRFGGNLLIEK